MAACSCCVSIKLEGRPVEVRSHPITWRIGRVSVYQLFWPGRFYGFDQHKGKLFAVVEDGYGALKRVDLATHDLRFLDVPPPSEAWRSPLGRSDHPRRAAGQ